MEININGRDNKDQWTYIHTGLGVYTVVSQKHVQNMYDELIQIKKKKWWEIWK